MKAVGLFFGTAFGFVLAAARLSDPEVIHAMLELEDAEPYLIMGSAIAVALPLLWLMERKGWVTPMGGRLSLARVKPQRHHVVGSVLFGAGWALAATCPAPALVMVGSGALLALVVMAGMFAGILARDVQVARDEAATGLHHEPAGPCEVPELAADTIGL